PRRVYQARLVGERTGCGCVRDVRVLQAVGQGAGGRRVGVSVNVCGDARVDAAREPADHVHVGPRDVEVIDVVERVLQLVHVLRVGDTADCHLRGLTALRG